MTRDPRRGHATEPPARASRAIAILTQPSFLLAVGLLLLNDWVLKPAVGGWWTGKLSDVAGLFAFPLFWSAFFPQRPAIYALTAVGFLVWKSPLSDAPLAAWNALGAWPLTRVLDYTDWLALAVLVPSYRAAARATSGAWSGWALATRRAGAMGAAAIALIAFAASSRLLPTYTFEPRSGYAIGAHQDQIRAAFDALGIPRRRWASHGGMADTLDLTLGKSTQRRMTVLVELRDAPTCGTVVTPLTVALGGKRPDIATIRAQFVQEVVEPLRTRFSGC